MIYKLFVPTATQVVLGCLAAACVTPVTASAQSGERNKALARQFYEQVWFSRSLAAVDELVAPDYIVHDIGDRKAVREPADEQKQIADLFWRHGEMNGRIDFQVAEGDLVATRWQWEYQPRTWFMKIMMIGGRNPIPIVNVFRFQDGKIIEMWNHRHDIDVGFASNLLRVQGFGAGVMAGLLGAFATRIWRRRRDTARRVAPRNTPLQPTSGSE